VLKRTLHCRERVLGEADNIAGASVLK